MRAKNQFSRRQLRIKIFQLIYGLGGEQLSNQSAYEKLFAKSTQQTEGSFTALVLFVINLFEYSLIVANREKSRYIQEDIEEFDTDIARLSFVEKLKNNPSFQQALKDKSLQHLFSDEDIIKKTFQLFKKTEEYTQFLSDKINPQYIERLILRAVEYTFDEDELGYAFFEEKFINWDDDSEIIAGWVQVLLKKPAQISFSMTLGAEKIDFANELITTYYNKYDYLNDLIKPKLKNWDADRVAVIDTILLRLGLAELLYFPDIPIKVTINEFIDIAKQYSTEQSGQFINGVLDNLRKDLQSKDMLRKHS